MKTTLAVSAIAFMLVVLATPTTANHGLNGQIVGTLEDGTPVRATMSYVAGNFDAQTWQFQWMTGTDSFTCHGFGSVETGFTGFDCAVDWSTGPTGDSHTYPNQQPDVHMVDVSIGGVDGAAAQVLLSDI